MTRNAQDIIDDMRNIVKPRIAKMLLKANFEGCGKEDKAEFETEFEMLLTLAEKALEQESCDKCVYSTKDGYCQYDDITETIPPFEPYKDAINPQQKVGRWIPVSERLPENKTYVLTTIKVPNRIAHARSGWYEGGFFHNDNGDTWKATDIEVKAWMPLPEPFKGVEE